MRRREFIGFLGATAWPIAARAQQAERLRRIGVLLPATADDVEFQARFGAFLQGLQQLGWSIGHNVRIDTRWATANAAEIRRHAAELAALAPDVILAHGASTVGPLLQATHTVPIVFPIAVPRRTVAMTAVHAAIVVPVHGVSRRTTSTWSANDANPATTAARYGIPK